ncbi:uncharacterized protein LOC126552619 [Aphis gossypii]|uniref:uncharacterized protein LOC126552619 n=1 Tax=Aphis gossypii TaxID=80765 RepID=UPI00215913BA|nr:uncharacterized protein LOC126552619 [Aphis gossypii]
MPKKRCVFTPQLKLEFPFLQDADEVGKIFCTICKSVFSIEHGGRSDITQHVTKVKKHLLALSAASKHEKVTSFFFKIDPSGSTDENRRTAAQEGIFAFHTVVHNHSFRSMDCTSSLLKQIYNKKFTCARTKAESIVLNVLAPFAMQQICKEIENINFATIMIDTSNHKNLQIVPILIRYFDEDNLFDEFSHVEQIFKSRIHEWQKNSAKVEVKWCEIFEYTKAHNIDTTNISKIVEYSLAIPGTNAAVERIFSIINVLWTDEKNRFLVESIKSIIIVKTHFKNLSCNEFYYILLKETRLLDEIGSAQKYTKTSKEEIYVPSSSK